MSTRNNPRLIGTSRQISRTRTLGSRTSLFRFTFWRFGKIVAYILFSSHILPRVFPNAFLPIQLDEFNPVHEIFVRRLWFFRTVDKPPISLREILMRAVWAVYWAWSTFAFLDGIHSALSIICVSVIGFDQPENWPPLFGTLAQAYTINRFWSRFWHGLVVRPYMNFGSYLSRNILRFPRRSLAYRALVPLIVFFLSGLSHAGVARQLGDDCGWTRDITWFLVNYSVAMLEIVAAAMLRVVAIRCGSERQILRLQNSRYIKFLGFCWVYLFFFWSVPRWQYPKMNCAIHKELARITETA